ncbi:hypothetical protein N824_14595 [Pedobacter sp. V48]|nr:hypothetical protein N824_14595 [Pedobacter sp. V48]
MNEPIQKSLVQPTFYLDKTDIKDTQLDGFSLISKVPL